MRESGRSVLLMQDDGQAGLQRLAQHEAGLRQRALGGVDGEDDRVHHRQTALDLATEVGVARGVDDVDGDDLTTILRVVLHGRVLGQDRDALLTLQVVRVHHAVVKRLGGVRGEGTGLLEHGDEQGGLAMVDVGDDGDVADVVARGHIEALLPE